MRPWRLLLAAAALAQLQACGGGELVWSDEFDGPGLNPAKWTAVDGMHHGPHELQLYRAANARVEGGSLVLETRREPAVGPGGATYNFTSAWVTTGVGNGAPNVPVTFARAGGRWEVRARLPPVSCPGVWPAHWLLPPDADPEARVCWPTGGEVDIMEMWGRNQGLGPLSRVPVAQTLHWGRACGRDEVALKNIVLGRYPLVPWAEPQVGWDSGWHVFAAEWRPGRSVRFEVDGAHVVTLGSGDTGVPPGPLALILNTALDAHYAKEVHRCSFPVTHEVDYVRVFALDDE
mmetsp:Transcript_9093/g.31645  ORF Transcript_9093/g.31645 Transcript_9093/m.31645 type:complete len:290 (-) Transcript_9093:468-1337(-)